MRKSSEGIEKPNIIEKAKRLFPQNKLSVDFFKSTKLLFGVEITVLQVSRIIHGLLLLGINNTHWPVNEKEASSYSLHIVTHERILWRHL